MSEEISPRELRRLSRRSFLWAGATLGGGLTALAQFNRHAPKQDNGLPSLFETTHGINAAIARTLFAPARAQDRLFPADRAVAPRNNYHGGTPQVDPDAWRLAIDGGPSLTLADLKTLPEVTQTTELKCVEGWSVVVTWTGARFIDFAAKYPPPPGARFVSMRSEPEGYEDDWYYVGLDLESCLHPQTLLAWAMNGAPLTAEHGAPLRLVIPHKYGIKNIKLITQVAYATQPPADYWAEQGYDWYAGL
jgi:DMSO/TMAO reductase YedYZ molybdopterin-dependent catalytic subunit